MNKQPEVVVTATEELFTDRIGQRWSPAVISIAWKSAEQQGLPSPSVTVHVIAPARAEMTAQELRQVHLVAARDVLRSAILAL